MDGMSIVGAARTLDIEFDGWPTERRMLYRTGGFARIIDTTRIEGPHIILGRYQIEYDAAGREVCRDDPCDVTTLYLH